MRKREGIEPRDARRSVGADLLSNKEGHIQGAQSQGSREPTGVGDRDTSAGQDRELGSSDALLALRARLPSREATLGCAHGVGADVE